jgi:ABC-type phosphate transport system substrate-binding protein
MKYFRKTFLFVMATVLASVSVGHSLAAKKGAGVVVIVKADGPLVGLSLKEIKAIYLGEKLFQGSSKIEPVMNGDDSVALVFFEKILGKTKVQYKKIWKSKAFVDALVAPSVLPHSEDVLQAVEKDEYVIGFVNETDLSAKDNKSVKVIFTAD